MALAAQALEAQKALMSFEWRGAHRYLASCPARLMSDLAKVSGPQNAGPLDGKIRHEEQKEEPSLEDVRSPRKTAGPRKRRSAARRIAGGACCTSAGGPKGLKAFGTGRSAGTGGCAHRAGDGTNALSSVARLSASPGTNC